VLADALEHLVAGIVSNPDDVTVRDKDLRRGRLLEVRVHPEDIGKVIGRQGRTASALRTVVGALAAFITVVIFAPTILFIHELLSLSAVWVTVFFAIVPVAPLALVLLQAGSRRTRSTIAWTSSSSDGVPDGAILRRLRLVDDICFINTLNRLVRRDDDDGQIVNFQEFVFLGLCRARHARELVVHTEVVLERDARERL